MLRRAHRRLRRALRREGVARLVLGVWLTVHGVVAAGLPAVDAMAGPETSVVAHWEDAQDTSCPPQHDPAVCQLCQQVTVSITDEVADRIAPVRVVRAAGVLPRDHGLGAYDVGLRGAPDPRGPPEA